MDKAYKWNQTTGEVTPKPTGADTKPARPKAKVQAKPPIATVTTADVDKKLEEATKALEACGFDGKAVSVKLDDPSLKKKVVPKYTFRAYCSSCCQTTSRSSTTR